MKLGALFNLAKHQFSPLYNRNNSGNFLMDEVTYVM